MFEVNEYTVLMTVESLPFGDVTEPRLEVLKMFEFAVNVSPLLSPQKSVLARTST